MTSRYLGARVLPFHQNMEGKVILLEFPGFYSQKSVPNPRFAQIIPPSNPTPLSGSLSHSSSLPSSSWLERYLIIVDDSISNPFSISTIMLTSRVLSGDLVFPLPSPARRRNPKDIHFPLYPLPPSGPSIKYLPLVPPEVLSPNFRACVFGHSVDVWSIGMTPHSQFSLSFLERFFIYLFFFIFLPVGVVLYILLSGVLPSQIDVTAQAESTDLSSWSLLLSKLILCDTWRRPVDDRIHTERDRLRGDDTHRLGSMSISGCSGLLQRTFCTNPLERMTLGELESNEWLCTIGEDSDSESQSSFSSPPSPSPLPLPNPEPKGKLKKKKRKMDKQF
jgi:hypothetical protein